MIQGLVQSSASTLTCWSSRNELHHESSERTAIRQVVRCRGHPCKRTSKKPKDLSEGYLSRGPATTSSCARAHSPGRRRLHNLRFRHLLRWSWDLWRRQRTRRQTHHRVAQSRKRGWYPCRSRRRASGRRGRRRGCRSQRGLPHAGAGLKAKGLVDAVKLTQAQGFEPTRVNP